MADDLTKNEGREVQLEEDPDLQLPFLLPEDGYSCDTARGIPNGLAEFIEPLARAGKLLNSFLVSVDGFSSLFIIVFLRVFILLKGKTISWNCIEIERLT